MNLFEANFLKILNGMELNSRCALQIKHVIPLIPLKVSCVVKYRAQYKKHKDHKKQENTSAPFDMLGLDSDKYSDVKSSRKQHLNA